MKTFIFTLKDSPKDPDIIWRCNAPSEEIAWDMFSLTKNLDKFSLKHLFNLEIKNK